jgi:hypothetical protein
MTTVPFNVTALDTSVATSRSAQMQNSPPPQLQSTDATAVFYVKLSDMSSVFKFQTDATDLNDLSSSDVKYYVFKKNWSHQLKLNFTHAMMNKNESNGALTNGGGTGAFTPSKSLIKHDFLRYIALTLFNTINGVDLFANETEMLENLAYQGEITRVGIESVLDTISTTSADITMNVDTFGNRYLTDFDNTITNISRELFNQIVHYDSSRLSSILNTEEIQSIPFIENDSLNIKLTIIPTENQHLLTGVSEILERTYNIKIIMKTDISGSNTVVVDSVSFPNSYPYASNVINIPANTPAVYADASPPQSIPIMRYGYNGWYYTNSDSWVNVDPTVRDKINWYLPPNSEISTVGDLRYIRMNLCVFNRTSTPFITVYTKATGSGDTGGWFKSKRNYIIWNANSLTNGTKYCFYVNLNSYNTAPLSIGHNNSLLTLSNVASSNVGSFASTEVLFAISIGSDSGTARGNVEFTLSNVIIGDASGEKEYGYLAV